MRESLETSDLHTEHRPPFLSLSLIKTVSSCVVQIVCVITNQGSTNPNCLNFLKDAYKVYQGVPPTYCFLFCKVMMRFSRISRRLTSSQLVLPPRQLKAVSHCSKICSLYDENHKMAVVYNARCTLVFNDCSGKAKFLTSRFFLKASHRNAYAYKQTNNPTINCLFMTSFGLQEKLT